ncbi:hypothetical protein [Sphingomonas paeninsulae]|uniref:hypothetical protein n=1 Tax=Sphingomonas paeninsulae TaxID=2319844 RepID=UPI0013CF0D37|nr:hypothetical protein [Sphingomonas paeninsulae]
MTRYRYVTPIRAGQWFETGALARNAAAKAGVAHKDDADRVWLDPLTDIEVERV